MKTQTIRFKDKNTSNLILNPITAQIFIDKENGVFKFVSREYIRFETFALLVCGNRQIRHLGEVEEDLFVLDSDESIEFFHKTNKRYDRTAEIYDRELVLNIVDDFMLKETGWLSLNDVRKINEYIGKTYYALNHYKLIRKTLWKEYAFEYVIVKKL